eukprot:PhF_6_TR30196/c0_g1_i1/m.44372
MQETEVEMNTLSEAVPPKLPEKKSSSLPRAAIIAILLLIAAIVVIPVIVVYRGNGSSSRDHDETQAPTPSPLKELKARVVVIGAGVAGNTVMYELTRVGIGSPNALGASGNQGIILLEQGPSTRPCGIIEPVNMPESTGLDSNPFGPDYKPYRVTTHAMRVNIATMGPMRCLANELNMSMYFSPWVTEYRKGGYRSYGSLFLCNSSSPITDGLGDACRTACRNGYKNRFSTSGPTSSCDDFHGSADLVQQSAATPNGGTPYTFFNYDPKNNYNQYTNDPEFEWYGWAVGLSNFYNPTANYSGDGKAYNGASPFPFDPSNVKQDHPRHRCSEFADIYTLYLYYLGPEYAEYICDMNVGFRGDCTLGVDACSYIGSSKEDGFLSRALHEADEGYPVGAFIEFCTRQAFLAKNNNKNVPVSYLYDQSVKSIQRNTGTKSKGKYAVSTRDTVVYADEVIIATEPQALPQMTGDIVEDIILQSQFNYPLPVPGVTISLHWNNQDPNSIWRRDVTNNFVGSYRMINQATCLNRIELLNTPYHKSQMNVMRVSYTDRICVETLVALAKLDDPQLVLTPEQGYPLNGHIAREVMREVRQIFTGEGPYALFGVRQIPDPDKVVFNYEPSMWYFAKAGANYSMKDIRNWATRPIASESGIMLTHQSWHTLYSGWALASVKTAREGLLRMYPEYFTRQSIDERYYCEAPFHTPQCRNNKTESNCDSWAVNYAKKCPTSTHPYDGNGNALCDAPWLMPTPAIDTQYTYANKLPNENSPPYSPNQQIRWQP